MPRREKQSPAAGRSSPFSFFWRRKKSTPALGASTPTLDSTVPEPRTTTVPEPPPPFVEHVQQKSPSKTAARSVNLDCSPERGPRSLQRDSPVLATRALAPQPMRPLAGDLNDVTGDEPSCDDEIVVYPREPSGDDEIVYLPGGKRVPSQVAEEKPGSFANGNEEASWRQWAEGAFADGDRGANDPVVVSGGDESQSSPLQGPVQHQSPLQVPEVSTSIEHEDPLHLPSAKGDREETAAGVPALAAKDEEVPREHQVPRSRIEEDSVPAPPAAVAGAPVAGVGNRPPRPPLPSKSTMRRSFVSAVLSGGGGTAVSGPSPVTCGHGGRLEKSIRRLEESILDVQPLDGSRKFLPDARTQKFSEDFLSRSLRSPALVRFCDQKISGTRKGRDIMMCGGGREHEHVEKHNHQCDFHSRMKRCHATSTQAHPHGVP